MTDVEASIGRAPRISCLMVTRKRAAMARRAIRCFQEQTYPEKELVILDDDDDDTLESYVAQLEDPRIVFTRLPSDGAPLGDLRNRAVDLARGSLICQWDDDDLSHRQRLERQTAALQTHGADACFLARHRLLWTRPRRIALSTRRVWEGSIVASKARLTRYPSLRRGEDTPVVERLSREHEAVLLDAPELYTYVIHGTNTFPAAHFEEHWRAATERWIGAECDAQVKEILGGLPPDVANEIAPALGAMR
jgi:glycosyltransferase involved in cell wall biosynthesis